MPQNAALWLVVAYLVAVPWMLALQDRLSGHDAARLVQVVLGLGCALALVIGVRDREPGPGSGRQRLPMLALGVACALGLASTLHAAQPGWAWREVQVALGLAAIAAVVARRPEVALPRLAWAMTIGQAVYGSLLLLLAAASLAQGLMPEPSTLVVGFENYRLYNHVQTLSLPWLAALAVAGDSPRLRAWARYALVLQCMVLWFFAARGTLLALGASVVVVLFVARVFAWRFVAALGLGLAAGGLLWAVVFHALPALLDVPVDTAAALRRGQLTDDGARYYLWAKAWQQIQSSPWLGVGPMHYAHFATQGNVKAAHPHNLYLQLAAEWGLPFAALALAWAAWAAGRLMHTLRAASVAPTLPADARSDKLAGALGGVAALASLVALAVDSLVSGTLVLPVSQVWAATALGLAVGWWRLQRRARSPKLPDDRLRTGQGQARVASVIVSALVLISQLALTASALPQALAMAEYLKQVELRTGLGKSHPRFWSRGWF